MVLLTAETRDSSTHGTVLSIWEVGGNHRIVEPPFQPYSYSLRPVQNGVPVKKILLSDLRVHTVYKVEYPDETRLEATRNAWTIEDRFPFKTRVGIDLGYHFPSEQPKVLAYDIETYTELTPDARKDRIRSIACWNGEEGKYWGSGDEKQDILDFIAYVKQQNPDIICDFYGRFYDLIVLIQRCAILNIKLELGRNGGIPYLLKREFEKNGKGRIEHTFLLPGRIHFDVQKETDADYTLTLAGLKDRGLKQVAKHYGFNPIEIDYEKMDQLSPKELADYNISDAYVTYKVGWNYLGVLLSLSELLDLPLDTIIQRTPSFIPNVVLGRELGKIGVISDGSNKERFSQFWAGGKKAVQGAEPKCFKTGVYTKDVKHHDFSSMYVSIMRALNLSPETISLISITPYTGQYKFNPHKDADGKYDYCICELPDELNGQVTVKIDLSKKGVMRTFLDGIVEKRNTAKKLMKAATDEATKNKYASDQIALKLVGNIMWGYNSMPYAQYGNVLIAVCCTAIPRLLINEAMKLQESVGNSVLEADTDGIWVYGANPCVFDASKVLPDCFDTSLITMSDEDVQGIILLEDVRGKPAAKSYILKEEDGKITKHGSSILGRHIPLIVDHFVDDLAKALFDGEDAVQVLRRWNASKIEKYPVKAFVQFATFSKRPDDYDTSSMYAGLIKQLKAAGIDVQWGQKVNYVCAKSGYTPTVVWTEKHKVDAGYYQEKMASVASRILCMPYKTILSYMKGDQTMDSYFQTNGVN